MKINYTFANGETSDVEVNEEIGNLILDSRREESNQDRKERYHCYSLDAVSYTHLDVYKRQWLNRLIETILNACGLDTTGKIGSSIQFFIYDTIKIMVLLGVLILIISYIQSYFPPERAKKILGRFHGIWANIIAALLGTVTPFCSCSSIPLFIGFTSAGLQMCIRDRARENRQAANLQQTA